MAAQTRTTPAGDPEVSTFDTPEPISVSVEFGGGVAEVQIIASDRTDTRVNLRPADETSGTDTRAAGQIRMDYAGGRLLIQMARQWRSLFDRTGCVYLLIELPTGSHVRGEVAMGAFRANGRLGECALSTHHGDIRLDQTGPAQLATGTGEIVLRRASGDTQITVGSGDVRVGEVAGTTTIKNSNGATRIGEVTGPLHVRGAKGDIIIGRVRTGAEARAARGDIRVAEAVRGTLALETGLGEVEVGVVEGTAAWLDLSSLAGSVRNSLAVTDGPGQAEQTLEVWARTSYGDIVIRRA